MMTIHSAFIALLALCAACSVSNDQEVAIGKQDSDQINAQLALVTDPAVTGYVDRLGQAIASKTSRADLPWHFYVVNTGEVNAFALPGGFIYINRGLIEQSDRLDELAGTIGHEIGHVVRRHAVDQMEKQSGANIGISLACTLTRICQHAATQVMINAAGSALFARYSRQDESQADSEAVVNVVNAGIDPRGIPELFEMLIRQRQHAPSRFDAFFASHPLEEARVTATREQIAHYNRAMLDKLVEDDSAYHKFKHAVANLPPPPAPARPATQP